MKSKILVLVCMTGVLLICLASPLYAEGNEKAIELKKVKLAKDMSENEAIELAKVKIAQRFYESKKTSAVTVPGFFDANLMAEKNGEYYWAVLWSRKKGQLGPTLIRLFSSERIEIILGR